MAKALSIQQPWAWAILHAGKDVENRPRLTHYRGPIVVHAGKRIDNLGIHWLKSNGYHVPDELPTGALLGEVEITDCTPVEQNDSIWAFGPYCYELSGAKAYAEPIPYKGQLGLFNIPDDILPR